MKTQEYKVSILVPVYGVERYIERCTRSLFEQTYDNLEFIFVDDCTPDKSIEVLINTMNDYPNRSKQIRIIHHEKNKGLSGARHTAISNATGEFIIHVDSDDWLDLDSIERLVDKQLETGADIVSANTIKEGGIKTEVAKIPDISDPRKMIAVYLSSNLSHQVCGRLIRRSLYSIIKGPKTGVDNGEDTQTMPQLFYYSHKLANVNRPLYHYFIANEGSLTHIKGKTVNGRHEIELLESAIYVRDFFKDKDRELESKANWYLAYRIWGSLIACAGHGRKLFNKVLSYQNYVEDNPYPSIGHNCWSLKLRLLSNYYTATLYKALRHYYKKLS